LQPALLVMAHRYRDARRTRLGLDASVEEP
jgi:hypothetical protein